MDSSRVTGQTLLKSKGYKWVLACLFLSACSTVPEQATAPVTVPEPAATVAKVESEPVETPEVEHLPLTADLTYLVLTAEIAKQRGDVYGAADLYQRAAESIDSPSLSNRSAQVANLTRDGERINKALNRWSEVSPNDANIYFLKVPFLLLQGKFEDVPPALNKALAIKPEKTDFFLNSLADNMSKVLQADQALDIMSKLDLYQQRSPEALYQYARLAAYYNKNQEALPAVSEVLEAIPDHQGALVLKAKLLQREGQGEQALALLKDATSKPEASKFLRFTYGQILGENEYVAKSQEVFEKLHKAYPNEPDIVFALGVIAIEQQQNDEARDYFNRLLDLGDPGQQSAYFLGVTEKQAGNITEALAWFDAVPKTNARYQAAQTHYISLLADNGALPKARLHLAKIREENPKLAIDYYLFESSLLRERHQQQASYDILTEALEKHADDLDLLYGRAMAAESIDRLDLLEQDLRKILAINPNHSQSLNALGYTLTDRTDRHQEALELINKALAIEPNDPFYLDSLGWVYYRLGDLSKAETYLQRAVDIQNDPEFLAHLGEVVWQQGEKSRAKTLWKQGLELDADNKLLLETMKRFGL